MTKKILKKIKRDKEILLFVSLSFLSWRIWLQVFLWLGWLFLPLRGQFLGGAQDFFSHPELWAWANFDGSQYLNIAQEGYGNFDQVFFPLYPWLMRILIYPFGQSRFAFLLSGLAISNLAFLVASFVFYKLIKLDFDDKVARLAILFLLVFPTSFFFGAVYTESLFLALVLGSFYAARKKNWWLAGILGALASSTRLMGIFLFPALLWEWWEQNKFQVSNFKFQKLKNLIPLLLVPLGLLFYMRFLTSFFQDPLMFFHVRPAYFVARSADKVILLYQVFWRYFKMIAFTKWDPLFFTIWLEFLAAAGFGSLLGLVYFKKIRLSYLIFASLVYLAPTLSGTFLSMPRYVLVLFPGFIVLALIKNKIFRASIFIICCLLLVIATIFFTRGYWIG